MTTTRSAIRKHLVSAAATAALVLAASSARAQVASLGKGWGFDVAGSLTSAPGEVISGRTSIKGSYSGPLPFRQIIITDTTFVRFAAGRTYTIALNYRILSALSGGFQFGFSSATGAAAGNFLQNPTITGSPGTSGSATSTFTLLPYPDYQARVFLVGTGTIVVDDIRITDAAGQLVHSENAEGPTIAPGPLNFQVTDATVIVPEADGKVRSAAVGDLNGDGYPETILTLTAPNPSITPIQPIVVE